MLTFLTFVVFNEIPTNPACLVVACGPHTTTTDAQIREADHRLGIDRPVFVQYGDFVWRLVRHGDFGTSWTQPTRVGTLIGQSLPVTASLVAGGMLLMLLLALPLGCIAALKPRTPTDRGLLALSVVGLAVHPFVLGITIRDLFAQQLHITTSVTARSPDPNLASHSSDPRPPSRRRAAARSTGRATCSFRGSSSPSSSCRSTCG